MKLLLFILLLAALLILPARALSTPAAVFTITASWLDGGRARIAWTAPPDQVCVKVGPVYTLQCQTGSGEIILTQQYAYFWGRPAVGAAYDLVDASGKTQATAVLPNVTVALPVVRN